MVQSWWVLPPRKLKILYAVSKQAQQPNTVVSTSQARKCGRDLPHEVLGHLLSPLLAKLHHIVDALPMGGNLLLVLFRHVLDGPEARVHRARRRRAATRASWVTAADRGSCCTWHRLRWRRR